MLIVQQSNSFGPEIPVVATNDVDAQLDRLISRFQSVASPLRQLLRELHTTYQSVTDGCIARYIPELALADPDWFGISVVTAAPDGSGTKTYAVIISLPGSPADLRPGMTARLTFGP